MAADITTALEAHYTLKDQGDDDAAEDETGNYDGVLVGLRHSTHGVPSPTGGGLLVQDNTDEITIANNIGLDKEDDQTIAFWAKGTGGSTQTIFGSDYSNLGGLMAFMRYDASGYIRVELNSISEAQHVTTAVNDGLWHHFAYVYRWETGSPTVTFWVDGATIAAPESVSASPWTIATNHAFFPALHNGLFAVSDCRLYTRAIEDVDVLALYRLGNSHIGKMSMGIGVSI
jgi:hypothetical protein